MKLAQLAWQIGQGWKLPRRQQHQQAGAAIFSITTATSTHMWRLGAKATGITLRPKPVWMPMQPTPLAAVTCCAQPNSSNGKDKGFHQVQVPALEPSRLDQGMQSMGQ